MNTSLKSLARRGQIAHLLIFLLMPIIMIAGITAINAFGKTSFLQHAEKEALQLCVIEDIQKISLTIIGAFSGVIIGLIFRLEEDSEFAKKNYSKRLGYMTVSLLTSACGSPYLLMQISKDQPKPLCLLVGMLVAVFAWLILEVFYTKAKGYIGLMLDKVIPTPAPKVTTDATEKDKGAPTG